MIDGTRRWTLLYWSCDRFLPFHGQRLAHGDRLRLAAVDGNELCTVGAGGNPVLLLDPQLRQTWLPQSSHFCSGRRKIYTAAATAVAHAVVSRDVGHIGDVGVVDDGRIHVRDLAVVVELVVIPIPAVVAATDIPVAVVHAAVVADVAAPKATMPSIASRIVAPVSGSP